MKKYKAVMYIGKGVKKIVCKFRLYQLNFKNPYVKSVTHMVKIGSLRLKTYIPSFFCIFHKSSLFCVDLDGVKKGKLTCNG